MAFKISEFKSTFDKYGGPSHKNLFEVIFTNVEGGNRVTSRDLTFFCNAAAMPGMQADVAVYQGVAQKPKTFVRGLNHDQVSCNFMLDSDHEIKQFFHLWMQRVVNYSTSGGDFSAIGDQMPYEIGYKDEYACRMTMRHYSTNRPNSFYEVVLDNAFPIAVGDVDLAWDAEGVAGMTVGFEYDRIQYSGEKRGSPVGDLGRGNGLLSMLNSIGTINQALDISNTPVSTQDALNRLNGIGNAFNTIGNFFNL
jgi:hypothetical protein